MAPARNSLLVRAFSRVSRCALAVTVITALLASAPVYAALEWSPAERISLMSSGSQIDDADSYGTAVSRNADVVAFVTASGQPVSGDDNGVPDVFVRDASTAAVQTVRVSVADDESQAGGQSANVSVSSDGTRVAFQSLAMTLVAGDDNGVSDVFVRDTGLGSTLRASVATDGTSPNAASYLPSISAEGTCVAFASLATNLASGDASAHVDVFVMDFDTGNVELISSGMGGAPANGSSTAPAISGDGRYVVFESEADNLVAGDSNSAWDVFIYDRDTGDTDCVSVTGAGVPAAGDSRNGSVSFDGAHVAFDSDAPDIVSGDSNGVRDVFLRNAPSDSTQRVSVRPVSASPFAAAEAPSVSWDGLCVGFASADANLVPASAKGADYVDHKHVFVWEAGSAKITLLDKSAGGLAGEGDADGVAISPDGRFAAFHSGAANLVLGDTNGFFDVFVVRIGARSVERVAGTSRFHTAVQASKRAFPGLGSSDSVVLATGYNWPDALGGAALAGAVDGPLLLCATNDLRDETADEIERLGASTVYILGGEAAVSSQVASQVDAVPGVTRVVRVAGANRYETATKIADKVRTELGGATDGRIFVATGQNFPDALAASPASAAQAWPILLADPRKETLNVPTWVSGAYVLGGTAVVSADIESGLETDLGPSNIDRWSGANRYATAVDIAENSVALGALDWDNATLATGEQFPDALAGGVMAGQMQGALLLTPSSYLHEEPRTVLEDNRRAIFAAWVMGGTAAVTDGAFSQVEDALGE